MFPEHKFILVDPAPFYCRNIPSRIEVIQDFFTDDMARKYSATDLLFVSDIRTADPDALDEEEVESAVEQDQRMQMAWHLLLNPKRSMLKFRLPWGKGTTKYLAGDVFMPVWGRQSTTETRLVATGPTTKLYDHTAYEEQMFYYNTISRVWYYHHNVTGVDGMCHCHDCASEVYILTAYLKLKAARTSSSSTRSFLTTATHVPSPVFIPTAVVDSSSAVTQDPVLSFVVTDLETAQTSIPKETEASTSTEESTAGTCAPTSTGPIFEPPTQADFENPALCRLVAELSKTLNVACSPTTHRTLRVIIGHGQEWFAAKKYDINKRKIEHVDEKEKEELQRKKQSRTDYERKPRSNDNSDIIPGS